MSLLAFYFWGVLTAFGLSTFKVLNNPVLFYRFQFKTVLLGCLYFSLGSWVKVAQIIYWEMRR